MRGSAAVTALLLACAFGATGAGAAPPPKASPPTGTLSVCNVSGARPITTVLTYTSAAPASAGGTQTFQVAVGACSGQVFYPQGTSVIVTETVPAGSSVTAITIGGGASTIGSVNLASGSATVTIGSGQSVLSFTTSGPAASPAPRACKVPNVRGLGLRAARTALVKASCTLGRVTHAYSRTFPLGRVTTTRPGRGLVLAHNAPVDVVLSRGPRP